MTNIGRSQCRTTQELVFLQLGATGQGEAVGGRQWSRFECCFYAPEKAIVPLRKTEERAQVHVSAGSLVGE